VKEREREVVMSTYDKLRYWHGAILVCRQLDITVGTIYEPVLIRKARRRVVPYHPLVAPALLEDETIG